MDKYKYVKAPPGHIIKKPKSKIDSLKSAIALVLILSGIASITSVLYPLISYELLYAPSFARTSIISPQSDDPETSPDLINTTLDYTDSSSWFVGDQSPTERVSTPIYTLSIPRLSIKRAIVRSDSTDLKSSLIHHETSPRPGSPGAPVIFGHSVLPQYFDPENYISIFSTLHTLKIGDEIFVDYDGIQYRYVIQKMYEVVPTDLSPLDQVYESKTLRLITCTPPGTYLRRLVVEASLI